MLSTPSNPSLVGFAVGAPCPPEPALVSSPALASSKRQKFVPAAVRRQTRTLHYHIFAKRVQNFVSGFREMAPKDCMASIVARRANCRILPPAAHDGVASTKLMC